MIDEYVRTGTVVPNAGHFGPLGLLRHGCDGLEPERNAHNKNKWIVSQEQIGSLMGSGNETRACLSLVLVRRCCCC